MSKDAWEVGDRVRPITVAPTWTNDPNSTLTAGIYKIAAVDEYFMCGLIEVTDGRNRWPVDPGYLEWVDAG